VNILDIGILRAELDEISLGCITHGLEGMQGGLRPCGAQPMATSMYNFCGMISKKQKTLHPSVCATWCPNVARGWVHH
jgi:hypothetical protein